MREKIIQHLLQLGADSISGVTRAISAGRKNPIHRLTIAGYLEAMTDAGVLSEMERPPSKLYRLRDPDAHRTIHDRVGRYFEAHEITDPLVTVAALQFLFSRPLFAIELEEAGVDSTHGELQRATMGDQRRRDLVAKLQRYGLAPPPRDPLLQLPSHHPAHRNQAIPQMLRALALHGNKADDLRLHADGKTLQTPLQLEGIDEPE